MKTSVHLRAAMIALGALIVAAPAMASPQTEGILGVWQITKPTVQLRPVDGVVPFTKKGRDAFNANLRMRKKGDFDDYDVMTSRCANPGMPRMMLTAKRFKLRELFNVLTFTFEWNRLIRQIDLRGLPLEKPLGTRFTGVSRGRWVGDTLVAETTDVPPEALIDESLPHSWDMKVTEHYRLVDPDTLEDRITITDPEYYKRPWDAVLIYKRQPFAVFAEDVCLDRLPHKGGK
ncbi:MULTISPECIES: hypothetical protein [unclassified Novosphingobium]|uniref:hypothetical protein n=1 Tax=unclassified Novosphingobium TaxID=2644732 RepID=UPI001835345B|nr:MULTISPECIES: hypothetical protein [unclassified Novosphingobium]NMN04848.1 hypothetical protein [Novosphingobium sp. SG919]NMN85158.1 hypothetical protein [Novosphingobium sp. SG916]